MNEDSRRILSFFAISMLILFLHQYFFSNSIPDTTNISTSIEQHTDKQIITEKIPQLQQTKQQPELSAISINSDNLIGSFTNKGLRFDNIVLKKYKKNIDDISGNINLLQGDGQESTSLEFGFISDDKDLCLPTTDDVWEISANKNLTVDNPVELSWKNDSSLMFKRILSIDNQYVTNISTYVTNNTSKPIVFRTYARIYKNSPTKDSNWSAYQGPIGYLNAKLEEVEFDKISDKGCIEYKSVGGWVGMSDKYWLVSLIPDQSKSVSVKFSKKHTAQLKDVYEIEILSELVEIPANSTIQLKESMFTGAKEIKTLDMYEEKIGVPHFDLAIDFGWLYFITKPMLYSLVFIKDLVGNLGFGILILTLILKLLLLPLANKSYRSMNRMRELGPKIQEIQKRYANDRVKLSQELSAIYKREKINPAGGCLPTLLQSPILFALYKVLYVSIEMRQAPFVGWITDLSMPDPYSLFNLFGFLPIELPSFLQIGMWPILMGLSMFAQQKLSPAPADQSQAQVMLIMPLVFTFMFAQLPSGLVIYWTFGNVLSIAHQYFLGRTNSVNTKMRIK